MVTTPSTPIILQSVLRGKLVLDRQTAETVGRVEHLWLDDTMRQVVKVTCKSGLLDKHKQTFSWSQVDSIGADSMMVTLPGEQEQALPEGTEPPVGHELWTDSGNRVGTIRDYQINLETGEIVDLLFTSGGWRGLKDGIYCLKPEAIVSFGSKRVICQEVAVETAEQMTEGMEQRMHKVQEFLQKDYKRTQNHLAAASEGSQAIASQVQDKTHTVAEQAKEAIAGMGETAHHLQEKVMGAFQHKPSDNITEASEHDTPDSERQD
jgi:uncharacterized protein YrrD